MFAIGTMLPLWAATVHKWKVYITKMLRQLRKRRGLRYFYPQGVDFRSFCRVNTLERGTVSGPGKVEGLETGLIEMLCNISTIRLRTAGKGKFAAHSWRVLCCQVGCRWPRGKS